MQVAKFKTQTINAPQTAFNIAKQIKRAIIESQPAASEIAYKFDNDDIFKVCKNLYLYCKKNIKYKAEGGKIQTARTLPRMMYDINRGKMQGDCKHYSTFIASILQSLGVNYRLRMISQNYFDKEPTHIYIVAFDENDNEIIIDPCMLYFDNEAKYNYKYDIKVLK